MVERAGGVDARIATPQRVADFDVGHEVARSLCARSRAQCAPVGNTFNGNLAALAAIGFGVDRDFFDRGVFCLCGTGAHRVVRPEAVLVIGHPSVQPGEIFPRRVAVQIGKAVGAFECGEHLRIFVLERHQVARFLSDDGFHNAVVERVGSIVFSDHYRRVFGARGGGKCQ